MSARVFTEDIGRVLFILFLYFAPTSDARNAVLPHHAATRCAVAAAGTHCAYSTGDGSKLHAPAGSAAADGNRALSNRRVVYAQRERTVRARARGECVLTMHACRNSGDRRVLHVPTEKELVRSGAPLSLTSHRVKGAHFSEVMMEYSNHDNDARLPQKKGRKDPRGQVARTASALLEVCVRYCGIAVSLVLTP